MIVYREVLDLIIVDQDTYGGGCNGGGASPSYAGSLCYSYRSSAAKLLLNQPEINHHRALHLSYTVAPSRHTEKIFISHRVDQKSSLLLPYFTPSLDTATPKLVALRVSGVIKHLELQVSSWLRLDMWHGCRNSRPTERKSRVKSSLASLLSHGGYKLCTSWCLMMNNKLWKVIQRHQWFISRYPSYTQHTF